MRVRYAIGIAVTSALLGPSLMASQAPQTPPAAAPATKKASPQRGIAELGYMQTAKLEGNTIVTTFQIKNLSAGSIVGFTITEFWYDKAGNALQGTGDRQRLRSPLQPGEVATITLRSPKVPGMTTGSLPQYKFEHNYGSIKPTRLKTLK